MAQISSSATDEASARMNEVPKAVFSNTLSEPLAWRNTRLIRGDLLEGMRALKHDSHDPLREIFTFHHGPCSHLLVTFCWRVEGLVWGR